MARYIFVCGFSGSHFHSSQSRFNYEIIFLHAEDLPIGLSVAYYTFTNSLYPIGAVLSSATRSPITDDFMTPLSCSKLSVSDLELEVESQLVSRFLEILKNEASLNPPELIAKAEASDEKQVFKEGKKITFEAQTLPRIRGGRDAQ